jgi:cation:H+ antiporter
VTRGYRALPAPLLLVVAILILWVVPPLCRRLTISSGVEPGVCSDGRGPLVGPEVIVWFVLACVGGLGLLAFASDHLVVGACSLAERVGVPALAIGVVLMGFGTSAPEAMVAVLSSLGGDPGVSLGDITGSVIANLTLVLGSGALVAPVAVVATVIRREAVLTLAATVAFVLALQDGLGYRDGVVLFGLLAAALLLMLRWAGRGSAVASTSEQLADEVDELVEQEAARPIRVELAVTVAALLGTLAGAQALVWGAVHLASAAGVSDGVIGVTLVAIGTSLPELVTTVQAARRRQHDLLVGNLLGSNLFNCLGVAGVVAVLAPGHPIGPELRGTGSLAMLATSLLALAFMRRGLRITRFEGGALLASYAALLPLIAAG